MESPESWMGLVISALADPVFVKDETHRFVLVNDAFCTFVAKPREALLGRSDLDFFPPAEVDVFWAHDDHVFDTGEIDENEEQVTDQDGNLHHIITRKSLLRLPERKLLVGVIRDVTQRREMERERRRIEDQMQHAQRLESLGVLAGGIAHDFNNLLAGILANITLVRDGAAPLELASCVADIEESARRMADLTRQMLAYAGRQAVDFRPLDLVALLHEVIGLLRVSIHKRSQLKLAVPSTPVVVEADKSQLVQVLMNLIVNASEALPEGAGEISIALELDLFAGEYADDTPWPLTMQAGQPVVRLRVSDDGHGMSPEVRRRIFDPFFTTKFAGRGLGLSAVLGIIRSHRGALRVTTARGIGTAFEICLPQSTRPLDEVPRPPTRFSRLHGKRALVIDDERIIRDAAARILRHAGLEVLEAKDADEALQLYLDGRDGIDVVVCDMTLPGRDGREIYAALRAAGLGATRFIVMSGHDREETLAKFAVGQVASFVSKPFASVDLLSAVDAALAV